ncbi:hypothetical protein AGABI1DRAFT_101197 [Agaricus bisporus var. burnettii JB137-S8]|uniref:MYND-type domain-containing protein n=1 Tax=Agaricus bisporus var. burnettii (strain JB137-S8 / ATCC MYA-4627 / FGSC 10392) TaxID=597362 RepID=K5WSY3_AGABU|nr:uncharacterized protein AGABI1DRAFT_101197 [Agaricus bisporus var. burnettii JB137-S8]EKM78526.1 hypothetical protein AGABI1DRAFT_101197 [Agaricus bisporus var. burnettii JB137-S8]
MNRLAEFLSRINLGSEAWTHAESLYRRDMSSTNPHIRVAAPHTSSGMFDFTDFTAQPPFPPPQHLLCANVDAEKHRICEKAGTQSCSRCSLVLYCSKDCQRVHWYIHKQDCKNPLLSESWRPGWVIEDRLPSFFDMGPISQFERWTLNKFSGGLSLWGNMPAMDILNLRNNEADYTKDLSLAFIAIPPKSSTSSGDLRHVVRTVNALPSDYSGNLRILLNDKMSPVACRNMVLLLILGTITDEVLAADIALHFWYSAFLPIEYRMKITAQILEYIDGLSKSESLSIPLGHLSNLFVGISREAVVTSLTAYFSLSSVSDIQSEYDRVRNTPSRRDFRDRMYAKLRPAHRVAFQEYRRFGIVLPFGAVNAHFNAPNLSLFSPDGTWLQTDYADPLEGWNLDDVIKAGKTHGALPEDIYGCLYFFLSDELRSFHRRIRQFHISFNLYNLDASELSRVIRNGSLAQDNLPASIRFDRIEVSNILDAHYVGLRDVLAHWAPLLTRSTTATIIGYFMNWTGLQKDGDATTAESHWMATSLNSINALYDNSRPFKNYLKSQGLDNILCHMKLKLRGRHVIASHTQVANFTWTERFVEFAHDGKEADT